MDFNCGLCQPKNTLLLGGSSQGEPPTHSQVMGISVKNKCAAQPKIVLASFAMFCAVAFTVIPLSFPCRGELLDAGGNPTGEPTSTPAVTTTEKEVSAIEGRITEEKKVRISRFAITPHRQNYFLAVTYDSDPNTETYEFADEDEPKHFEAKFQLSFKLLLWDDMIKGNGDLFCAYTQRSWWQVYDKALSSPFRETNYEPEIFVKFDTDFDVLGLRHRLFVIGLNHQSNGNGGVLSRSWNRVYADLIAERGDFVIGLKPWYRIPEHEEDDDNPDIEKYMGYGELFGAYRLNGHVLSFMARHNLRRHENKGALELGWSFPITDNVRGYVQYFNGYGESLVDYNDSANRIGVGLMLFDWI
jgi:phospholipase A1